MDSRRETSLLWCALSSASHIPGSAGTADATIQTDPLPTGPACGRIRIEPQARHYILFVSLAYFAVSLSSELS
jgi:hypothetical protein